jgi:hypothetical protein
VSLFCLDFLFSCCCCCVVVVVLVVVVVVVVVVVAAAVAVAVAAVAVAVVLSFFLTFLRQANNVQPVLAGPNQQQPSQGPPKVFDYNLANQPGGGGVQQPPPQQTSTPSFLVGQPNLFSMLAMRC